MHTSPLNKSITDQHSHTLIQWWSGFKLVHYTFANQPPSSTGRKCCIQGSIATVKYCLLQLLRLFTNDPKPLSLRHAAMFYRESFVKED